MDYLLFRLYGPLASWGEIAVGETRNSASYPSKSAILGLVGAALGVNRSDSAKQQQLQDGYHLAVEVVSRGNLLRDYHTTQVPDSVGKVSYQTRRDELVLGRSRLGTILSTREYRTDAMALVAVKALSGAPFTLPEIKNHLVKPKFHLYLGRKSCPLAVPLHPHISVGKDSFLEAFMSYKHKPILPMNEKEEGLSKDDSYWLGLNNVREYYWEGESNDFSTNFDLGNMQSRVRHDQPLSRNRWQFTPRMEHYLYQAGGK